MQKHFLNAVILGGRDLTPLNKYKSDTYNIAHDSLADFIQ